MATEQNIHSAAEWEDIPAEKFEIIGTDDFSGDIIARPKIGYWADAWRRLKENKIALVALIVLLLLIVMVCIGPVISGYNFEQMDTSAINQKPSAEHWFGTDSLGRDLFARVWQGGRVSIMIGVVGAVVASVIGCIYGGIASYFGGIVDDIMMRIVEVLLSIPYLIIVILISVVTDSKSIGTMMLALTLTGWCGIARLVRGQMLQLKSQEYVLAANALGVSPFKTIMRHMIPNTIGIIIVAITFDIPGYIFIPELHRSGHPAAGYQLGCACIRCTAELYVLPLPAVLPIADDCTDHALLHPAGRWTARRPRPETEKVGGSLWQTIKS